MEQEPTYPVVRMSLRWGKYFYAAAAVLPLLVIFLLEWPRPPWPAVIAGIIMGGVTAFLAQSYLELLRIIADTLLPR